MNEHADAVVEVAGDGIDFDGLRVTESADGYAFRTPTDERTGLDEAGLREAATDSPYVTNWYYWHALAPQKDDRWAFLRWAEGATDRSVPERYDALVDGVTAEWGQLRVTVTIGDGGERRYELRHVNDEAADSAALEDHDDPLAARDIAKHDDDGRYRPLKTAPSLRTGWRFTDLDGASLVETVDFFYPATIANWHREREGDLDVTHWRETAERQTGIYEMVEGLDDQGVAWMAEACCVDSQCLKRREWDVDEDTPIDVPRGDGEFPCREPCSLVIAAARKFTTLESETTRTFEIELTLSELNQIGEIVDAVADGRTDEIREADVYDGANRYRARFLRAKLFDENGDLPAVECEE